MAESLSGMAWTRWPMAGAVGAGRSDELDLPPGGFGLTPSGETEQAGQEQFLAARAASAAQAAGITDVPAEQEADSAGPE